MTELQASRTLVKSPPELWAECSDAASLARHLGQFGAIRITRLEPETAVAWEGERARGTVRIEPAGWGTKVILTAVAVAVAVGTRTRQLRPHCRHPPNSGSRRQSRRRLWRRPRNRERRPREAEPAGEPADEMPAEGSAAPPRRRLARLLAFLRGQEPSAEASGLAEEVAPPAAYAAALPAVVAVDPPAVVAVDPPAVVAVDPPAADPLPPAAEAPPAGDEPPPSKPDTEAALAAALESLGQAHHRPYSRA